MTVDEIMAMVDLHYYADTTDSRLTVRANIRHALEAQAARIAELEGLLQQAEVKP